MMSKTEQWMQTAYRQHAAGDFAAAEPLYKKILTREPRHLRALYLLGSLYAQLARHEDALLFLERALAIAPDHVEALNNRGVALKELGRFAEAVASYNRVLALRSNYAEAYNNRGAALQADGRLEEAADSFRQALALKPDYEQPANNLGMALKDLGKLDEAESAYRQALAINPNYPEALNNLSLVLQSERRYEEALACQDAAVALASDFPEAHNNRGLTLKALRRFDDARAAYARALQLRPDYAEVHCNLATCLLGEGRFEEAMATYEHALASQPEQAQFRWNRAIGLLLSGQFAKGWSEYEWRFPSGIVPVHRADKAKPRWDGSPLGGRTILVHAEQGLGDTLQFVRFLPRVKAMGGRVLFECQPALRSLIESCAGIDAVLDAQPEGVEHAEDYDVQIPLLSVPDVLGIDEAMIPVPTPYLQVPDASLTEWSSRLAQVGRSLPNSVKVGLVWAGNPKHTNDENRSCSLDALAPLGRIPGVTFYSLQVGPRAGDADHAPAGMTIVNLGDALADFSDTAAVLTQLDLVITVDTSVAHLAGALGRPVWMLLPFLPDWRWRQGRTDTPWYTDMRLFRQTQPGEWNAPVAEVAEALSTFVAGRALSAAGAAAPALDSTRAEAEILVLAGETLFASGDTDGAAEKFRAALAITPDHGRALNNLGVLCYQAGEHDEAVALLSRLLESEPGYPHAYENLARCWTAKSDDRNALLAYQKALALAPRNASLWNGVGRCCARMGVLDTARDALTQSLALDGSQTAVREALAEIEGRLTPPTVSIIIPCYKQAHFLPEAVASVAGQTYTEWEIVIVNDGSPDDTSDVARSLMDLYPDKQIRLVEQANGGLSAARNAGIAVASGSLILPLDADDKLAPTMLAKTVRALDGHLEASIAFTHLQHFGTQSDGWSCGPFTLDAVREENKIPYCSLMRREMIEALGGYQVECMAYEDWDLWLSALSRGYTATMVAEPLLFYRKHAGSKLAADNKRRRVFEAQIMLRHADIYPEMQDKARRMVSDAQEAAQHANVVSDGTKPRVLIAVEHFYPSVGGAERLALDIGLALQKAGNDVEVLTRPLPHRTGDIHSGIRIHEYHFDAAGELRTLVKQRGYAAVILATNPLSRFFAGAADWDAPDTRLILVPCINTDIYRSLSETPELLATLRRAMSAADINVSSSLNGIDARFLAEESVESVYVPNAVHRHEPAPDFHARYGIPTDRPMLLVVGNCWPEKNHAGLLNLLRDQPGDWSLVHIGHESQDWPAVAQRLREIVALDARVIRINGAPPADVSAAMEAAELLLLPSLAEATPLVLVEAMSHGLPWLASPVCGSAHDHAGGMISPVAEFPAAIDYLLANPEARKKLGKAGRAHWDTCYTWDVIGPRYAALASGTPDLPAIAAPVGAAEATQVVRAGYAHTRKSDLAAFAAQAQNGDAPTVSVVIGASDAVTLSPALTATLNSLLAQTYCRWTAVVVTDDDIKALYADPRIGALRASVSGLAAGRNAAIAASDGAYVLPLSPGDLLAPDALLRTVALLESNARLSFVYSDHTRLSAAGLIETKVAAEWDFRLQKQESIVPETALFRRALWEEVGGYRDKAADMNWEFWLACGARGCAGRRLPHALVRWGSDAETAYRAELAAPFASAQVIMGHSALYTADDLLWARVMAAGFSWTADPLAEQLPRTQSTPTLDPFLRSFRAEDLGDYCRRQFLAGAAAAQAAVPTCDSAALLRAGLTNAESQRQAHMVKWQSQQAILSRIEDLARFGYARLSQRAEFTTELLPVLTTLAETGGEFYRLSGFLWARRACEQARAREAEAALSADAPLVSIVIRSGDDSGLLSETLADLRAQTYLRWEALIVIQAGPSEPLFEADPRIRFVNAEASGSGTARNAGIAASEGVYILTISAGDRLTPDFVARTAHVLSTQPGISIVSTDREHWDGDGHISAVPVCDYNFAALLSHNLVPAASLFRRQAWVDAGGYAQDCGDAIVDHDFWIRCGTRGHSAWRVADALFSCRVSAMPAPDAAEAKYNVARIVLRHAATFGTNRVRMAQDCVAAYDWLHGKGRSAARPADALVSVIVPTYKRPDTLAASLQSILDQTYRHFEIIVVNDAGPDVSEVITGLNAEGRITLINKPVNKGPADSRNLGIAAARGKYIAYLDDDDAYYPDHLETLVTFLESTGGDVAYTDALRAHQRKTDTGVYETFFKDQPYGSDFDYERILVGNHSPVQCFMHRRSCVDAVGAFDTTLSSHEDWEMWLRLGLHFQCVHLARTTSEFTWRSDGTSLTSADSQAQAQDFARTTAVVYRKHYAQFADKPQLRAQIDAYLKEYEMAPEPTISARMSPPILLTAREIKQRGIDPYKPCPCGSGEKLKFCHYNKAIEAKMLAQATQQWTTDIIVVVHNQLEYTRRCIESLFSHTRNFHLLLWDNGSDAPTQTYLAEIAARENVTLRRSEENMGFIQPNNRLAALGKAPYLILLNSDTEVSPGWDSALIDYLTCHPQTGEVGYGGGLLDANAVGCGAGSGDEIDYVAGWCAALPRRVYAAHGLFDETNLTFAYGEDSDLSLRLQEAGYHIHALPESRVSHFGNKTILEVAQKRDTRATFAENHAYLRTRWAEYLKSGRVLACRSVIGTAEWERRVAAAEDCCRQGDRAAARSQFSALLAEEPDDTRVLNGLGVLYWQDGEHRPALQYFVRALQISPQDRNTTMNLVDALHALGQISDACALCDAFLGHSPEDTEVAGLRKALEAKTLAVAA